MTTNTITIQNQNHPGSRSINFLDILLDETLTIGTVYIPYSCFEKTSAINHRLPAKQVYELLLRLSLVFPILLSNQAPDNADDCLALDSQENTSNEAGLKTDCYITARYKKILLEQNLFDLAADSILTLAKQLGCQERIIHFLEEMLKEQNAYYYFFQGSQPFLIYTGDSVCYNILNTFAKSLGSALQRRGCLVEYFDTSKEEIAAVTKYAGQHFQAVIGMQSFMFSVRLKDERFIHDQIHGPKYNFIFDHPVWLANHLKDTPKNLTVFTLDRNYTAYAEQYYTLNARFLPPGGIVKQLAAQERVYDVTFIGSYLNNAQDVCLQLKNFDRPTRFLINRLWLNMRRHPQLPAEDSLSAALQYYGRVLSDTEFMELFHDLRTFVLYISYRYRYKLMETLIHAGIKIDVFGASWEFCPLRENPNLIWHKDDLSTDECLSVWRQSKIALNMMSWHKNAITERILNSMLQKAAVLTERNPYLEEQFQDGKDILFYQLSQLDILAEQIHALLSAPDKLAEIGEHGCQKAMQYHTWDCRADELLQTAKQDSASMYQ